MQVWTSKSYGGPADSYDYDLIEGDRSTGMFFSQRGEWAYPGAMIASITDTGNGLIILLDGLEICLDYHQAHQLLILLMHNSDERIQIVKAETIKSL